MVSIRYGEVLWTLREWPLGRSGLRDAWVVKLGHDHLKTPAWTWGSPRFPLKGSFKGDIDINVGIDLALDARGT